MRVFTPESPVKSEIGMVSRIKLANNFLGKFSVFNLFITYTKPSKNKIKKIRVMYTLSSLLFKRYLSLFIQIIVHPDFHFSISTLLVRSGDASFKH